MSDNTSNSAQDSRMSPTQHKQANIPSLASVIENLQTIPTNHGDQYHQARLRERDFHRFLDDEITLSKAQDSKDRVYGGRIAQLRKAITTKDVRIKELEAQLASHQALTHTEPPLTHPPTTTLSEPPTSHDNSTSSSSSSSEDQNYCYCLRPSSGPMVASDNPSCPRQWFHFHHTNLPYLPFEDEDWT